MIMYRGEGEETENQRECRLSAQSLVCLTTLCERLDSTSERERIMKIILNKHLFKHLINLSPQVRIVSSKGLHRYEGGVSLCHTDYPLFDEVFICRILNSGLLNVFLGSLCCKQFCKTVAFQIDRY